MCPWHIETYIVQCIWLMSSQTCTQYVHLLWLSGYTGSCTCESSSQLSHTVALLCSVATAVTDEWNSKIVAIIPISCYTHAASRVLSILSLCHVRTQEQEQLFVVDQSSLVTISQTDSHKFITNEAVTRAVCDVPSVVYANY